MKHLIYTFLISTLFLWNCNSNSPQKPKNENTVVKYSSIVEIVAQDSTDTRKVITSLEKSNISKSTIYQWKNHIIIYDTIQSITDIKDKLISDSLNVTVNYYETPFYIFDRSTCDNKSTVSEWSHTIMTANLVADTTMQKEYMDYHATQYENWPEVANGFCKADFQQLLVFRNGRQLMLIISIPKGENLDDLNPKTTENNPRVDEWNKIMSKYQEGIEGTKEGESWVVLTPIQ